MKVSIKKTKWTLRKYSNNFLFLVSAYVFSIFLVATLMYNIESASTKSYLDWIYFAVISSLSIGYGDITPQTDLGKSVASISGIFWLLGFVPLFLTHYISRTVKNDNLFNNKEQIFVIKTLSSIKKMVENLQEENKSLKEQLDKLNKVE